MTRRLPLFLGAVAFVSGLATAEAGHAHFSGGVHFGGGWSGGVHVSTGWHWSRPTWQPHSWGVSGSIYVGSYYPRPYYYYSQPEYVPSYYGASYYPVTATAAPGYAEPILVQPELPKFGIGLFAGGVNVTDQTGQSVPQSSDVGALARFRLTPGLILEGEIGKTSFDVNGTNNLRVDRRLGGSLIYEIGAYNRFAPYLLVGMGVQQADVGGNYSTTQDFGEMGAGLRYAISSHFHIAFDLRVGSRKTVSNDTPPSAGVTGTTARSVTPPTSASGQSEDYTRGRLSAILYF
jgi:hypothetical protein